MKLAIMAMTMTTGLVAIVRPLASPLAAQAGSQVVAHVLEEPGWVGITPDSTDPLIIGLVAAGTPAARAGILPGDRIVSIDGTPATPRRLYHRQFPVGELVQLTLDRGSERLGTFTFAAVENPYAAYLSAQAREDSVLREARAYRLELARSAAISGGVDSGRVVNVGGRDITVGRVAEERAVQTPERPLIIVDGKVAGITVRTERSASGAIAGRVTDRDGGAPLKAVSVRLAGTAKGSVTDADGIYAIADIPEGIYSVHVRRIGYAGETIDDVRVVAGEETTIDVVMGAAAVRLQAVVVARSGQRTVSESARLRELEEAARRDERTLERFAARTNLIGGATLEVLNPALGEYFGGVSEGVFVIRVAPASPAATAGLRPGDVIESVNGRRAVTLDEITALVADARGPITLSVLRRGQRVSVPLRR